MSMPTDPILHGGLEKFAQDLRAGNITSLQATQAYLLRIEKIDKKLQSYQFVNYEGAIATAKAMDALLAAGTDLGPLMGVPIAVKDVFTISGHPLPTAGSVIDLSNVVTNREGSFIQTLRRCGVVILGSTKAVELCLGITGVSAPLGTPWNPWDMHEQRVPGGSSSGSAVACAAGLCAFSVGTDTGGSVRTPAAFNGLFGLKTSFGRWPRDGSLPLDPTVDTIGLLAKTAQDCQLAFYAIEKQLFGYKYEIQQKTIDLSRLCLGLPKNYFYDDLTEEVDQAVRLANATLEAAGCKFEELEITEAAEREHYFPMALPASLIAMLGEDVFEAQKSKMDPIVAERISTAHAVKANEYIAACTKRERSIQEARRYFECVDAIACPTTTSTAPLLETFADPEQAMKNALGMSRNTQPVNYLGQCAVSMPLPRQAGQQAIGYQLIGAPGADVQLMNIAVAIERVFGLPITPDLSSICRTGGHNAYLG